MMRQLRFHLLGRLPRRLTAPRNDVRFNELFDKKKFDISQEKAASKAAFLLVFQALQGGGDSAAPGNKVEA